MEASNVAFPNPGTLTRSLGAFAMRDAIHLGSRADRNAERHFLGRMAGLMISLETLTDGTDGSADQVGCIFRASEEFLPAQLAECSQAPAAGLSMRFLGSIADVSGNARRASLMGSARVTTSGVEFSGQGDYVSVPDFSYETGDGTFSVSFWMTKEECTDGIYDCLLYTSDAADE